MHSKRTKKLLAEINMRCLLSFQACLVGLLLHVDLVLPKKIQTRQFKLNAASRFRFDDVGAVVAIWLPTAWGNPRWTSQHPVQVGGGVTILTMASGYDLRPCEPSWLVCEVTGLHTLNSISRHLVIVFVIISRRWTDKPNPALIRDRRIFQRLQFTTVYSNS